jgi:hypothetical protein
VVEELETTAGANGGAISGNFHPYIRAYIRVASVPCPCAERPKEFSSPPEGVRVTVTVTPKAGCSCRPADSRPPPGAGFEA